MVLGTYESLGRTRGRVSPGAACRPSRGRGYNFCGKRPILEVTA